jgi:hypothetical protein
MRPEITTILLVIPSLAFLAGWLLDTFDRE